MLIFQPCASLHSLKWCNGTAETMLLYILTTYNVFFIYIWLLQHKPSASMHSLTFLLCLPLSANVLFLSQASPQLHYALHFSPLILTLLFLCHIMYPSRINLTAVLVFFTLLHNCDSRLQVLYFWTLTVLSLELDHTILQN